MTEIAHACPTELTSDAAYLLTRAGALQIADCIGPQEAAAKLYALADEMATEVRRD